MKAINILVIDDHEVFASTLAERLRSESHINVLQVLTDAAGLMDAIKAHHPNAILMDIRIGKEDGLMLTGEVKAAFPKVKVILMSGFPVGNYSEEFGADAFFPKEESFHALVSIINDVCMKDKSVFHLNGKSILTEAERNVLKLLSKEQSNKEIAKTLYISERTVNNHVAEIYRKLEVQSRAGAAVQAVKMGLL
ncbi:response regulator transcription factor [Lachnospiraceae bacterium ZAX-1]